MTLLSPFPPNLVFLITIARSPSAVRLSSIEQRILRLVVLGCDEPQIAAILGRSLAMVHRHKVQAIKRLGTGQRRRIARWAIGQGLSHRSDRLSPSQRKALAPTGGLNP